jgi:hypothetical protein
MARNDEHRLLLSVSTTETSAAQEALQSNLHPRGKLIKKLSWYDAARGFVQKGALHAKGLVDTLRKDITKEEQ